MMGKTFRADFNSEVTSKIELFKKREELSTDSAAIKKLVTFALDIMERSADAPAVSNREIFEELLFLAKSSSSLVSQAHSYTFRNDLTDEGKVESKVARVKWSTNFGQGLRVFLK